MVSRVPALQEVIGQAGLFFEAGNAEQLATAIRWLCDNRDDRAALVARSVEQAKQFSLAACCTGYETLYKAVAGVTENTV